MHSIYGNMLNGYAQCVPHQLYRPHSENADNKRSQSYMLMNH